MVDELNALSPSPFCWHGGLAGFGKPSWQDGRYVLRFFVDDLSLAGKRYLSYVESGLDQQGPLEFLGGGADTRF